MSFVSSSSALGIEEIKASIIAQTDELDALNISAETKVDIIDALVDALTTNLGLTKTDVATIKGDTAIIKGDTALINTLGTSKVAFPSNNATIVYPNSGYAYNNQSHVISPRNDGYYYVIDTLTLTLYDADSTLVWSVSNTDINISATYLIDKIYWDSTTNKIYACGFSTGNLYFVSISPDTGVITPIQTITVTMTTSASLYSMNFYKMGTEFIVIMGAYSIRFDVVGTITKAELASTGSCGFITPKGYRIGYIYATSTYGHIIVTSQSGENLGLITPELNIFSSTVSIFSVTDDKRVTIRGTARKKYYETVDFLRWIDEFLDENLAGVVS